MEEKITVFIDTETLTDEELYASDEEYQKLVRLSEEAEKNAE